MQTAQRIEGAEFNDDVIDWDDDFLPRTPSSTTSVLQRLQELEHRDPALHTFTENSKIDLRKAKDHLENPIIEIRREQEFIILKGVGIFTYDLFNIQIAYETY